MATNETAAIRQTGTAILEPTPRHIRLGELSFTWQAGALRWLRVGDVEVVRGIAAVLRDPQWGTHAPAVDDERVEVTERHASLAQDFHLPAVGDSQAVGGESLLRGQLRVEASEDRVTVDLTLEALADVTTARSGLSVLLPLAGVAGAEIQVLHTDGRRQATRLPRLISPSQPLFEFRQLQLAPALDVTATITFEGDVFEMEDQRNWSDASFKIYNRPLAWPTPYVLKAGDTVSQRLTVSLRENDQAGNKRAEHLQTQNEPTVRVGEPASRTMPSIGCGVWLDRLEDVERLARQLDAVAPRHLDVLLDLRQPRAVENLAVLMAIAAERDVPVWLYVICEDHDAAASLSALAQRLERLPNALKSLPAGMLVTPAAYLQSYQPDGVWPAGASPAQALAAARELWPEMTLGGGVPTYFTELNRCRPDPAAIEFITHAVSPIVHAADDRSVMETLESVPHIIASCRALAPAVPYRITTTAIGAWTNPYGDTLTSNDGNRRVTLSDNDPRQQAQFAAAWNVGFVARALSPLKGNSDDDNDSDSAGVDALTLSSLGPPFDIGDEHGTPVRHVIVGLARASGQPLCESPIDVSPSTAGCVATLAWRVDPTEAYPIGTESRGISEAWVVNLATESVTLGLKRVEIVDAALLAAAHDGFQPAPEFRLLLEGGGKAVLPPLAILRVRWRE